MLVIPVGGPQSQILEVWRRAPDGAWDRQRREGRQRAAAARLAPGLAMAFDGQVDERRFQQARLEVIPAPRIVAFGSSRVRDVSGEAFQAAPETLSAWPTRLRSTAPVARFQMRAVLSSLVVASFVPSGEKATYMTGRV